MTVGAKRAIGAAVAVAGVWAIWSGNAGAWANAAVAHVAGPELLIKAIRDDRYDRVALYVSAGRPLEFPAPKKGPDGKPIRDPHAEPQPLVEACGHYTPDFALLLLKAGAKVNVANLDGTTPLHAAARIGSGRLVYELLQRGADVNCKDANGSTPLDIYLSDGQSFDSETLRLLLSHGARLSRPAPYSFHPENAAYDTGDPFGAALIRSARVFKSEDVEWLLQNGANANAIDRATKATALMIVVTHAQLGDEESRLKTVECLLRHGANPNLQDATGRTALHMACANHATRLAEALLRHGADPNAKDSHGKTPLDLVIPVEDDLR
jgi:ankyrin repeat protein